MPAKSEDRFAAEVKMLRRRLAQCERAMERLRLAEKSARGATEEMRALLVAKSSRQQSPTRVQALSLRKKSRPGHNEDAREKSSAALTWGSLDAWVSTIAHELKQPLTAIVNYTRACSRLVEQGAFDAGELLDALQKAASQAERAADMIQQLRRVAVPGRLQTSPIDVAGLCREVLALMENDLQSAGVDVQLETPGKPATVQADNFQIRLVLLNLVRNAVESLAGSKKRSLCVTVCQQATEVEVAVQDTGGGLSLAMVRNLFEPYQSTKPEGMGLGLALCRAIVQAHGGRIWAKSHRPRGTTFTFTLPMHSPL